MRRKLLLGNWKMNKTLPEAIEFAKEAKDLGALAKKNKVDMGVCCPYIDLFAVKKIVKNKLIVGSENVHYLDHGAYTGEVSIPMLKSIDINWAIVGHSERRTYDNETSEKCNLKIKALLANEMTPVYCCGETLETYEAGNTKEFVKEQIVNGFKDIDEAIASKVVIAYEPIWSIGTGKNASKEIAEDICAYIRGIIRKLYGAKVSNHIRILYGGSVKPENVKEYLSQNDIDGALVGGASLKVDSFKALLTNIL
ncbi:MAG: triose-phosphate isomerase [Bacilli bacterium]